MKTLSSRLLILAVVLAATMSAVASATASDPIHIMALGDSITAGYTDNPGWDQPFGFGYRSGLYTRLTNGGYSFEYVGTSREPWDGLSGVPRTVVASPDLRAINQDCHRGYGGLDANFLTNNIGDWLAKDCPDVVLLMVGINSIGQASTGNPVDAENSLNTLVQKIVVQRPTAKVIVAQITPYATYTDSIVQYNNYITNTLVPYYTALGKNVTTVNQYANFGSGTSVDASLYANHINHPGAVGYDRMAQTWYNGIRRLGTVTHSAGAARPVLGNTGFESTLYFSGTHTINPTDSVDWAFTAGAPGAGSGIDNGNPYGVNNCTPSVGVQMGFLQGAGETLGVSSISQNMSGLIVGRTYSLSFAAKGINGYDGANPFSVSAGGSTLLFSDATVLAPATSAGYTTYSTTFVANATTMSLRFADAGKVSTGKVSWIDDIKLGMVTPTAANRVVNGGFEQSTVNNNTHQVNPPNSGWRFTPLSAAGGGSGIDRGDPYQGACTNTIPFADSQRAFVQGLGQGNGVSSIERDVPGFQPGHTYVLSFEASAIQGQGYGGADPLFISIGGNPVSFDGATYVSPSSSYGLYVSSPFVAKSETMTLRFADAGNIPVNYLTWIDDVQITETPEPATSVMLIAAGAAALLMFARRVRVRRPVAQRDCLSKASLPLVG